MPRPRQGKARQDQRGLFCSTAGARQPLLSPGGTHKSKEKALLCNGRGWIRKGLLALAASPCRAGEAKDKRLTMLEPALVRHQIMEYGLQNALSLAGSFV